MITRTMQRVVVAIMCFGVIASLFGCNKNIHEAKEWQSMSIYRSHSNWNACFSFTVSTDETGKMFATGHCRDIDGNDYSSEEEPIYISDKAVRLLRKLNLDELPKEKKSVDFGIEVLDGTTQKLTLTYEDATEQSKELSDDTLDSIFEILIQEFKDNFTED